MHSFLALALLASVVAACGGGGGGNDNENAPVVDQNQGQPDNLADQELFSRTVYPLVRENCATCHDENGPDAAPVFAHSDVSVAYNLVITRKLADLDNPPQSRFVTRLVIDQHFCWIDCTAAGSEMAAAISAWATAKANNNSIPTPGDDTISTAVDTPVTTGDVLANDSDPDGDQLKIASVDSSSQQGGTVTDNGNNTFTYLPPAGFSGQDRFSYTVADGRGGTASAQVTVTVIGGGGNNGNQPLDSVTAFSQTLYPLVRQRCGICHDGTVPTTEFANTDPQFAHDEAINNNLIDFADVNNSAIVKKLAVINHNCWNDCASDAAEISSLITQWNQLMTGGVGGNQAPIANPDTFSTPPNTALTTGVVTANDTDADGDTLAVSDFSPTSQQGGTVVNNLNGTFTYTPPAGFIGSDAFTYTISDGNGGTAQGTVTITVGNEGPPGAPVALDDLLRTNQNVPILTSDILGNDFDPEGDPITLAAVDNLSAQGGSVLIINPTTLRYTPPPDYTGRDSFKYSITDGAGGFAEATVEVNINSQPLAVSDAAYTYVDLTARTGNVLTNDFDIDGDPLDVTAFDSASVNAGTVRYLGNGVFEYTPPTGFEGQDSFQYTVSDGRNGTDTATVNIAVTQPVFADDNRFLQFLNVSSPLFDENAQTAEAYYRAIDPLDRKTTLEEWRIANGFDVGADAFATYINANDLGFTRRMFVRKDPITGIVASYVENYANIADAQAQTNRIATVAMEYTVAPDQDPLDPDAKRFVTFYVFDGNDNRAPGADLDGRGFKFVPGLCNTCHGGRPLQLINGVYPNDGDTGGRFIPWDLDTYEFQDATGAVARDENAFKIFNRIVLDTNALAATKEIVEGWYGGPGLPANTFNGGYVPDGWLAPQAPATATQLYLQVVAPYCRACHIMRGSPLQNDIDFASYDKFMSYRDRIETLVFDESTMPLALRTFERFWADPVAPTVLARAIGSARLLENDQIMTPGRPLANAGPTREAALGTILLNGAGSLFTGGTTPFQWTLVQRPAESIVVLNNPDQANANFAADVPGDYVVQLVVNDDNAQTPPSPPAEAVIRVSPQLRPISFVADIAPIFDECGACHLGFDNPRFNNLTTLFNNVINFVNLDDPLNSKILTKPSGNHHGGGTISGFETPQGEKFKRILRWITEGAPDN